MKNFFKHFTIRTVAIVTLVATLVTSTPAMAQTMPLATSPSLTASDSSPLKTSTYLSPVKNAPMVFTALSVAWEQELPQNSTAQISVRFIDPSNNNLWSDWYLLEPDLDGKVDADPLHPSSFLPVNPTKTFQYKVVLAGEQGTLSPVVQNLQFTYINSTTSQSQVQRKGALFAASVPAPSTAANQVAMDTSLSGVHIISRAEWGADESLRIYKSKNPAPTHVVGESSDYATKYADELKIVRTVSKDAQGNQLTWPQEYPSKVTKIFIHHTASTVDLDDPMKAIRDIYYFHTITRGWGDIGYNYIIDPQGNIYEGRAGGDGVVGAHAGPGNIGSVGIAVLGNYQDNDVPEPVIHSLVALINAKSKQYNIDPTGTSMFRGQNMPNVMGHRDIMSTSCPGQHLYDQIPAIRLAAKNGFKPSIIDRAPSLAADQQNDFQLAQEIPLYDFNPGEQKEITLTLKNTGKTTWSKDTYFIVNRDANANNFFLSTGVVQSTTAGKDVPPGSTATFRVSVQAGYKGGFAALEVFPMVNGKTKVEKYLSMPMVIKPAVLDFQIINVSLPKPFLKADEQAPVTITIKNTGNITWQRDGKNNFVLGADQPRDHVNKLLVTPSNRLAKLVEAQVKPGETGHMSFQIKGPKQAGPYREFYTPLIEGISWFKNNTNHLDVYVYTKQYSGMLIGNTTDTNFPAGQNKTMTLDITNTGGVVWNKTGTNNLNFEVSNPKHLVISGPTLQQNTVAPGETAHVTFTVSLPAQEGYYFLQIKPKVGSNLILAQAKNYSMNVKKSTGTITLPPKPTTPGTTTPVPQPTPSTPTTNPNPSQLLSLTKNIRIGLGFTGNPTITGNGNFHIVSNGNSIANLTAAQAVSVTYQNQIYTLKTPTQTLTSTAPPRFVPDGSTILQIQNWSRPSAGNASINYNQFRGILEVNWYNNQLVTINELPIENYLKGTGETKDSQPYEKLKSIIVVSRTYALFYVTQAVKFPGAPYNLLDDPQTSQKYVGFAAEAYSPNTLKAIADTAGQVVTYQGKLIKTPYFSSDDGKTKSAQEVWGWTDTPYLVSVPDPYCAGMALSGHGVGLSGCGSLGMAQAGKTYQEIIKYYYQGVNIQTL